MVLFPVLYKGFRQQVVFALIYTFLVDIILTEFTMQHHLMLRSLSVYFVFWCKWWILQFLLPTLLGSLAATCTWLHLEFLCSDVWVPPHSLVTLQKMIPWYSVFNKRLCFYWPVLRFCLLWSQQSSAPCFICFRVHKSCCKVLPLFCYFDSNCFMSKSCSQIFYFSNIQ